MAAEPAGGGTAPLLWAPRAWLGSGSERSAQGWQRDVLLRVGDDGCWAEITAGVTAPPAGAERLGGPLLPGLVNAHSHAFQRAFAGLTAQAALGADGAVDDFWSWRERMYRVAARITPAQLQSVAAQLNVELLQGGYTQVCEFHYLHDPQHPHAPQAPHGPRDLLGPRQPHHGPPRASAPAAADPLAMAWALADAAQTAGIGLTVLPTLYQRAGFSQPTLRPQQQRFACTAGQVWAACQALRNAGRPLVTAGLAVHSLRAASPADIDALRRLADGWAGPIHIHVAEQTAEVDDCLAATGLRPIAWLAQQGVLDARWQLVHATHATPAEIDAVAASGAGVVLCPGTEADLGDGLADLPGWLRAGVPLAVGSDSQATRCWREELRWLDYGQRLQRRQRNVAAAAADGWPSTGERLWSRMVAGSAAAAGLPRWGLVAGARADGLVVDTAHPVLQSVPPSHLLDALVFSSPSPAWRDVLVAGRWRLRGGVHAHGDGIATRFAGAMAGLWEAVPTAD